MTDVELDNGSVIRVALDPRDFDRAYNASVQAGQMSARVPTIVGEEYLVIPHVVRWRAAKGRSGS